MHFAHFLQLLIIILNFKPLVSSNCQFVTLNQALPSTTESLIGVICNKLYIVFNGVLLLTCLFMN